MNKKKIVKFSKILVAALVVCILVFIGVLLAMGEEEEVYSGTLGLIFLIVSALVIVVTLLLLVVECILEIIAECKEKGFVEAICKFLLEVVILSVVLFALDKLFKTDGNIVEYVGMATTMRVVDTAMQWWRRE